MELGAGHIRALRRLQAIGPSKVGRWRRAMQRHDGRKLGAVTVLQLWSARLTEFGWFDDRYRITAAGIAALEADELTPLERLAA